MHEISMEEIAYSLSNEYLHLIVLPTEKCNFRCTYCYEDFLNGKMPLDIADGVWKLIERRAQQLKFLFVEWFGGEPLLALDRILYISNHIATISNSFGFKYVASMTTNGYLLELGLVEKLFQLGIQSYQISIDGPQSFHDQTRLQANGDDSYSRIMSNIRAVKESAMKVNILLRIHITSENLEAMPKFLSSLHDEFYADERFSFLLKPIERLGGPNSDKISILTSELREKTLRLLSEIIKNKQTQAKHFCYAAKPNSFVIRSTGAVNKCTVALDKSENLIGYLKPNGSLELDNTKIRPWLKGLFTGDAATLACPLSKIPSSQLADKRRLPVV